jgi:hypothetical protein
LAVSATAPLMKLPPISKQVMAMRGFPIFNQLFFTGRLPA